jgi:GPI mannosyltransferase 3
MKSRKFYFALLFLFALSTRIIPLFVVDCPLHPDNVYQVLEPAHRIVHGYGLMAWEHFRGIRPPLHIIISSTIFEAARLGGFRDTSAVIFGNRALMAFISLMTVYYAYKIGSELYGENAGLFSAYVLIFSTYVSLWSAETSSQIPSSFFVLPALLSFYRGFKLDNKRQYFFSGLLVGVGFMFRFDIAIFLFPMAAFLLFYGWKKYLLQVFVGFLLAILVQGLFDMVYYGGFLHSPINFVIADFFEELPTLGSAPATYYLEIFRIHPHFLLLLPLIFERKKETYLLLLMAFSFFGVYTLISHKELRYVFAFVPLYSILAGRALDRLTKSKVGRYYALFAVAVVFSSYMLLMPMALHSCHDISGFYSFFRYVGAQDDSSGVGYNIPWFMTGGYSHMHKRIPMVQITSGDTLLGPRLTEVGCSKVNHTLYDHQCAKLEYVLADEGINYFIVEKGSVFGLKESKYLKIEEIGPLELYKRIPEN